MTAHIPALALVAILLVGPVASANDHGAPGPDEHVRLLAEFDLGADHYYVLEDHGAILLYRESNGVRSDGVDGSGVQPAWTCVAGATVTYVHEDDACAVGIKTPPDDQLTNGDVVHEVEHLVFG